MDKEFKIIVKAAVRRGWRLVKGGKHDMLLHSTGRKLPVSLSPSDRNAHKVLKRAIEKAEKEMENA
jgi:hypothetical protein